MKGLYSSPFRVYLCLFALAITGIWAGTQLPISLYPNSSKPTIWASVSYGSMSSDEFLQKYGTRIEGAIEGISTGSLEVEDLVSNYGTSSVSYNIDFGWGADPKEALREVQNLLNAQSGSWPREARDSLRVNFWSKSSGFIAISFFSEERSLDELYDLLEPLLVPKLAKVGDAEGASLWNPNRKEVRIELNPEAMAQLGLFPRNIEEVLRNGMAGYFGGSVVVGTGKLTIQMPRELEDIKTLENLLIPTQSGTIVHLSDIARIDLGPSSGHNRIFKTNGADSLILFANPRTGGNVKRMAEEILTIIEEVKPQLPGDVQYRNLVDPSEFIRQSVSNVIKEVFLAAGLAVLVLFLFIGSFKNTITAAIEIPLSMILAFIMMKVTGMNLNLISLGGLALSAGMNVDASVVVMENIFRHFEKVKGPLNYNQRLQVIIRAVKEVMGPVVASTIASLVVFAPLAFTSDLTNAILGDLAKAVVFSHGFSAFVALILVPTIRLHLMKGEKGVSPPKSPINGSLIKLENGYATALRAFIKSKIVKWIAVATLTGAFVGLLFVVMPKLKKEIIGTPDTDWMILSINTSGNTNIRQMETTTSVEEARLLEKFGADISYTFVQIRGANNATVMARLINKEDMNKVWKSMEGEFQNTPTQYYWVGPWNPAELPLPDPPHMRLLVRGGSTEDRRLMAKDILDELREKEIFSRQWSDPGVSRGENIEVNARKELWPLLYEQGARFSPYDVSDLARVATEGKSLGDINIDGDTFPVRLNFPEGTVSSMEDLMALPIRVGDKILPFKALNDVSLVQSKPRIYRENGRDIVVIMAKEKKGEEHKKDTSLAAAKKLIADYDKKDLSHLGLTTKPQAYFEDADKDLNGALKQLTLAVLMSILLIFLTLLLQFGSFVHTMIVLVAVPLGIMGVLGSLFVFSSTLSLNSALGIILLNGIAVANSILLVDFIKKLVAEGMVPLEAAVLAGKKRMRPILITSLTTILGMLPIAMGSGEGGKILQPLGIAVSGGLWISTLLTLFLVPMLEVQYLDWKRKREFKLPRPKYPNDEKSELPQNNIVENTL
ncbi:MAG: hypothetical protein CME70_01975 [Halobacteriovorax sp.]|nr:hypothetical protein [Halobacteriovorax sp.]